MFDKSDEFYILTGIGLVDLIAAIMFGITMNEGLIHGMIAYGAAIVGVMLILSALWNFFVVRHK